MNLSDSLSCESATAALHILEEFASLANKLAIYVDVTFPFQWEKKKQLTLIGFQCAYNERIKIE